MAMKLPRQRRAGLLLAGIATLGWAAALALAWFNASLRLQHQADLRQLDAARKTLGAEIDPQRQATGTLPEPLALPPLPEPGQARPEGGGDAGGPKPAPSDRERAQSLSPETTPASPRPESLPSASDAPASAPALAEQQQA